MRAVGEGSLYKTTQHGRTYWVAQVVVGTYPNGKQKYARAVRKYRSDALQALDKLRGDKAKGIVPTRSLTTERFLKDWLDKQMPKNVKREKNQKQIKSQLTRLVLPTIGAIKLVNLTTADIEKLLDGLIAQGYAPKTVNDIRSHVVTALNYALKHDKVHKNVASLASTYTQPRPDNEGLTVQQVQKIHLVVQDDPHQALWVLALRLGLRKSELRNLNWLDVDLERGLLTIKDAKTIAGDRELPLVGETFEAMKAHHLASDGTGYVFRSVTGIQVPDSRINEWWSKILKAAGIDHRTFHGSTRDTITNLMHECGVDHETREYILGHGVKGVAKHYLKPTQQALRAALLMYEEALAA